MAIEELLGAITDHEEDEPLLGESDRDGGLETEDEEQRSVQQVHYYITHDPLHVDIIHGGEVLFTPEAVFADIRDEEPEKQDGIDSEQDAAIDVGDLIYDPRDPDRESLYDSAWNGHPTRPQDEHGIEQEEPEEEIADDDLPTLHADDSFFRRIDKRGDAHEQEGCTNRVGQQGEDPHFADQHTSGMPRHDPCTGKTYGSDAAVHDHADTAVQPHRDVLRQKITQNDTC